MITKKFLRRVVTERKVTTPQYLYTAHYGVDAYGKSYIAVYSAALIDEGTDMTPPLYSGQRLVAKFTYCVGWELYNN